MNKMNKNSHKTVISINLILAVSTIFLILINTLTFSISSYKPMNLKRCLITIAIANGLVALTSFLATISISIMVKKKIIYDIKMFKKGENRLKKEITRLEEKKGVFEHVKNLFDKLRRDFEGKNATTPDTTTRAKSVLGRRARQGRN